MADLQLESDGLKLWAEIWTADRTGPVPGVVIAHGFPSAPGTSSYSSMPSLAERISDSMAWNAMAFTSRGIGRSEGDFSLAGWSADLGVAVDALAAHGNTSGVWVVGFGTGGALALSVGATHPKVAGVATVGSPADFDDWAENPEHLLAWSRKLKAVRSDDFPSDFESWSEELRGFKAEKAAAELNKPLLVLHGSADDVVPQLDARAIADAHGKADLRIIVGGGHGLRHDPRSVAVLLGWLDRQWHETSATSETPAEG